jgi:hypothetical protein
MKREEIQLVIVDAYTPTTLPMIRLAEYLRAFAGLLGHEDRVHFAKLQKGSARLLAYSDLQTAPKLRARLDEITTGTAPKPAMTAHRDLDNLLAADNAFGHIELGGSKMIEFPGRRRPSQEKFGPVRRHASIEGQIYQIGGRDETINIHLRDGEKTHRCEASIDLSRKLLPYFLGARIRIFGEVDWFRTNDGWVEGTNFTAHDFVELDRKSLSGTVASMQRIFEDVKPDKLLSDMNELRHG